ncbi:MAG: bifunctional phosphoribosylaminoimidazolecarboxamide formyltransferase/IMP cyclohydrolase [Chloroflexi bacterium]|nr:bifunctional phosphoribosylaminoimidazolecarboxamide formyltransferase/IMP cyclohydrolase [Chloroflexota bacterium]
MRAIVSVSDRTNLTELVRGLQELGTEVFATDGTRRALADAGVEVASVGELTSFPELLGGRLKTIHPLVHGGILARRDVPDQIAQLQEHGIQTIDVVVVNLYPFYETATRPDANEADIIENIDVGGPALLRSAAKNFEHVVCLSDPADYGPVLDQLRNGGVDPKTRRRLAGKAFQHTAIYDTHIASYLRDAEELFPETLSLALEKVQDLRYGENPHQRAAFYRDRSLAPMPSGVTSAVQLNGIPLSFCNTIDVDAAWSVVSEFSAPSVAIIKHTNPCGLACAETLVEAYKRAHAGDPMSAFGGAIGLNRTVDEPTAREIAQTFYEDIIAPDYEPEALAILKKKKNLRILAVRRRQMDSMTAHIEARDRLDVKRVSGGFLVQTYDQNPLDQEPLKTVSERRPTLDELTDLEFAWRAVKHVKSNAIVLARQLMVVGVGAGQMSRVDSVELALKKANDRSIGSVLASDAFFPKPDGVEAAARGGVTAIIQPGGSIRDADIIAEANRHHLAMIFTGHRHFKH